MRLLGQPLSLVWVKHRLWSAALCFNGMRQRLHYVAHRSYAYDYPSSFSVDKEACRIN